MNEKQFTQRILAIATQLDGIAMFQLPQANGQSVMNPEAVRMYWEFVSKRLSPAEIATALDLCQEEDDFPRAKAFVALVKGSPKDLRDQADVEWMEVIQALDDPGYRPRLSVAGVAALKAVGGLMAIQQMSPDKRATNALYTFRDMFKAKVVQSPGCQNIEPDHTPRLPGSGGPSPQMALPGADDRRSERLMAFCLNYRQGDSARVLADAIAAGFTQEELETGRLAGEPDYSAGARALLEILNRLAEKKSITRPRVQDQPDNDESRIQEDSVLFAVKKQKWLDIRHYPTFATEAAAIWQHILLMADGGGVHPTVANMAAQFVEEIEAESAVELVIDDDLAKALELQMQQLEVVA